MRALLFLGSWLWIPVSVAQPYVISTLAGSGAPPNPVASVKAAIGDPARLAADAAGNVYFGSLHSVFKVDPTGTLTRIAGNGRAGTGGDGGSALAAQFLFPLGITVDAAGNVYIADRDANVVRRIATDGTISTVAGSGGQLNQPFGVAVDGSGNIFVSDTGNQRVVRISPDGRYTILAGGLLNGPEGIALDSAGNLYIADTFNGRIRKAAPDGTLTTVAGTGSTGIFSGDNGPAVNAALSLPTDVTVDRAGNLYIADFGNSRVRRVGADGIITTIAGSANGAPPADGALAINVLLNGPTGVAVDRTGAVYLVESGIGSGTGLSRGDYLVYKISTAGVLNAYAGTGTPSYSGDGGPAAAAQLNAAAGVAVDSQGTLYIADTLNQRLRAVVNLTISTVTGTGVPGFAGENVSPAGAQVNNPGGAVVDPIGRIYLADTGNSRVRRIDPGGNISTVAGNGNAAYYGDGGPARLAGINMPEGLALDSGGSLYLADTLDNAVRKVGQDGTIVTVAGTGTAAFSGDGGPAVKAALNHPQGVAVDSAGNVYIADTGNNRVRKVDPQGSISTLIAGLSGPRGVAVDRVGTLLIADTGHNQVLRGGGVIAGTGACCYAGDGGLATAAQLNAPSSLAVDSAGNVYIADSGNSSVRVLRPITPGITLGGVANAASNLGGGVAPGEMVTLYGSGLGGVQTIQFNGVPAPLLASADTQVSVAVPYATSVGTAQVVAQRSGAASIPLAVPVVATAPGLYTVDHSGKGPAAALNQDGSANAQATPAPQGSVISLFATGEGQTTPPGADGKPGSAPLPQPLAQVTVTIGGLPAAVQFAGGAPGLTAGIMQVNAVVPSGITGLASVTVAVGGVGSQTGVTIWVR
jgi:uncharacterized protein (TIGR03437 family)